RMDRSVVPPGKHMVYFMFGQAVIKFGPVCEFKRKVQATIKTQFLLQPPVGSGLGIFPFQRMAAARIGPESGRMVFFRCALLQQQFIAAVYDKYRKGTV